MEIELKRLSPEAVDRALSKAERYRLLNEPGEAESICLDVLALEPENQSALTMLVLALTDQFAEERRESVTRARQAADRIRNDYERSYYTGLILERRAKAHLHHATAGGGPIAYNWLREAQEWYERAEAIRPAGNDDSILRWNACARLIMGNRQLVPADEQRAEPLLSE